MTRLHTLSQCALILSLLPSHLVYALFVLPEQTVLQGQLEHQLGFQHGGVLKSFAPQTDHGWDVGHILGAAAATQSDVWRASPSQVDIYFPSLEDYHDSPFSRANLTQNTTTITWSALLPSAAAHTSVSGWDLTSLSNTTFHSSYHPLQEIEAFVRQLAALYPDVVHLGYLGHSAEGREMIAMRLSKGTESAKTKKGIVITGAQHAREWIASSTALYLAHALVSSSGEPQAMSQLLDNVDFYIIPIPNPDGYVYTWEQDRLWYKNRQIIGPNEKCVGIDMNRNWGYKWKARADFPTSRPSENEPVAVADPCTHWYPGHRAFEAPEVNNIANYITTLPALRGYIDLRSYGQILSTPFSYSCKKWPKDAENQIEGAHGAARALRQLHGTVFTTGSLCSMVYKAPGNIVDWMYAKAGITYSYAVHLRDTGTYGFLLPEEWIRPVGEETASMIEFMANFVLGRRS